MDSQRRERIGFSCAYSPLPLFDAAGFVPFRILPTGAAPDQAGSLLHDNMCPHVKRILDRALADDLPDLAGIVFMNSCDAMRRLADAWRAARPADRTILVDLPVADGEQGVAYFADELARLTARLSEWGGRRPTAARVVASAARYRELALRLARLAERAGEGTLPGGRKTLQLALNSSVTAPVEDSLVELNRLETAAGSAARGGSPVPLYLFGNVLPDPEALDFIEGCGVLVLADDLCTGSRQIAPLEIDGTGDVLLELARGLLSRPSCARTIDAARPGMLAEQIVSEAGASGARGVLGHVLKFCDPYLIRLPAIREALREAGLPLLLLEGDCTLRSLGQHRTRIEAFVEMLGGSPPP